MIQDIFPLKYSVEYKNIAASDNSLLIAADSQYVCVRKSESKNGFPAAIELPTVAAAEEIWGIDRQKLQFLFSIDEMDFFWLEDKLPDREGFAYEHILITRSMEPAYAAFAAAVGAHLAHWYSTNRFCGCCGARYVHSETQRAMVCPSCGHITFPRISPIVIAAVIDGDRILCARYNRKHYNNRSNQFVLLAGYVEIGESYEDAVRREIREETGLEIRKIRYVVSQPWPFSQTSIAGFYVEADSRKPLTRQEDELSELVWVKRKDLPPRLNLTSVTDNLFEWFRLGRTVEEIRNELE